MTPSEPTRKYKYRLLFLPSALKEWQALDGSVKEPLRKLLQKRLSNPHVPGGALHCELKGYYKTQFQSRLMLEARDAETKIKLNKQGGRLVYGVEDDALVFVVMAVDKRADGAVYRSVVARVSEKVERVTQAIEPAGAVTVSNQPPSLEILH